ncbi:MAG: serine/threonine protein kinase, partial [Treponema sp.]|nr:serine/threonine protein kinase [Treponema sp.]
MPKRSSTPTPDVIGKYRIINQIAQGGMGAVFKAVHPSLRRDVIIKKLTLRTGNSSIRERFKREAQILMDLSSPYIVRMFDFFTEARNDYIVLEFVDGMSLDKLLEKQYCLSPQLALLIFLDACYGLQSAHRRKIVHRDIKPGNILISRRGEVKLSDFGIAGGEKEKDSPVSEGGDMPVSGSDDGLTKVGTTLGTPAYMSPEQLDDSRSVDERADIYSMGVMLYQMTTGDRPYKGDMAPDTIEKIRRGQYIPPEQLNKSLPLIVRKLVRKMMQPDPRCRYQTIEPVIKKIKRYLSRYDRHEIRKELATIVVSANPG